MEVEKTFREFLEIIPDAALIINSGGTVVAASLHRLDVRVLARY